MIIILSIYGDFDYFIFVFMEEDLKMMRIFIIGTTAVGKTKLSVELAKYLKGEIISCDSKQLYKHASIMTAKVTKEEAQNIPHSMIDCLELYQNTYNRNKYFGEAAKVLSQIQGRKKSAIIVGGTNYYIQTLLFSLKNLVDFQEEQEGEERVEVGDEKLSKVQEEELDEMRKMSKQEKYQLLLKHDKAIAMKTHKNDEKKITIFLQRIILSKEQISTKYQQNTNELRSKNSIIFWVRNSDKDEHLGMVTKRIYKMLDKNGLSEIFAIYFYVELYNRRQNRKVQVGNIEEYSGACSSIGVRQFKNLYIEVRDELNNMFKEHMQKILSNDEIDYNFIHGLILQKFQKLKYSEQTLAQCRDQLILDTKHYCKRQLTWIRNKMFVNSHQNRSHFFALELSQQGQEKTDVMTRFDNQIAKRAINIVETIMEKGFGSILQSQNQFSAEGRKQSLQEWKKYFCEYCNLELNGLYNWNNHIESRRHKNQRRYIEKKDERDEYIKEQKRLAQERKKAKQKQKQKNQQELQK